MRRPLLAAVYRRRSRRISFARATDLFFAANAPWLLWVLGIATLGCLLTPARLLRWMVPPRLWFAVVPLAPVIAWSAYLDFRFCRQALGEPAAGAVRGVLLQRAIAWSCAISYYVGHEIWELIIEGMRS